MKTGDCSNKIGILGGTFNPIHNGHIELAKSAFNSGIVKEVFIMPNNIPAYKDNNNCVNNDIRIDIIKEAISNYEYMTFCDIELKRGGITYTIDTLNQLSDKYPDTVFYYIMGSDSLLNIEKWYRYEEILNSSNILVAIRDECNKSELEEFIKSLKNKYKTKEIIILQLDKIDISSSDIREMVKNGESVEGLLPDTVNNLIVSNYCYK